ncbi:MAG: DUF350 domain-containing protein [Alphaproteobacteria bacterium]
MNILDAFNIDQTSLAVLAINLVITVLLLTNVRFIAGIIAHVSTLRELAEKDNPAFGISIAGVALGTTIILTGVISTEVSQSLLQQAAKVAAYGIMGIALMTLTRFIFDKTFMPKFSVRQEILNGNVAAAVLDAGNVIATAVIVRAVMVWVISDRMSDLVLVLMGYLISQVMLALAAFYRRKLYNIKLKSSKQDALKAGNVALALRFVGYIIGVAFAVTSTFSLLPYYDAGSLFEVITFWMLGALFMMVLVSVVSLFADKLILGGIDVRDEVDNQNNVGIGVIQCVVQISVGLLIATILY